MKASDKEWAVAFNVEKTYGGDVDFENTEYSLGTAKEFFRDAGFMASVKEAAAVLVEVDYVDPRYLDIASAEQLADFFEEAYDAEAYLTGAMDAMPAEAYELVAEELEEEEEDRPRKKKKGPYPVTLPGDVEATTEELEDLLYRAGVLYTLNLEMKKAKEAGKSECTIFAMYGPGGALDNDIFFYVVSYLFYTGHHVVRVEPRSWNGAVHGHNVTFTV